MKSRTEIEEILDELRIQEPTRSEVLHIAGSEPARTVGGRRSVKGKFRSLKMDGTIQTESRTAEWAFAFICEYDPDILLFLDQPCRLHLKRPHLAPPVTYHPDFLVVSRSRGAELVEVKREDDLLNLSTLGSRDAWRYFRDDDGTWRSPPAEVAAGAVGLKFRIVSSKDIPDTLRRNYEFLAACIDDDKPLSEDLLRKIEHIKKVVAERPGIAYRDISAEGAGYADALNYAIVRSEVYVDLHAVPITDSFGSRVFADRNAQEVAVQIESSRAEEITEINLHVGAKFIVDGATLSVVSLGTREIVLIDDESRLRTLERRNFQSRIVERRIIPVDRNLVCTKSTGGAALLHRASSRDTQKAIERYRLIEHSLAQKGKPLAKLTRKQQRYLKAFREAEQAVGVGLVGLLPQGIPGNRTSRIDDRVEEIITAVINDSFLQPSAISKEMLRGLIAKRCAELVPPLSCPTRKTISRRLQKYSAHRVTKARFGSRAAMPDMCPQVSVADLESLRYGERAWDVAHIDHTQLDVEIISDRGQNLGRPWLTIFHAPKFDRVLGYYLVFSPPSYRSCMGVLRDCVIRHQRLPKTIVTDNGKEFHSLYLNLVLSRYKVHQQFRPPGQPRYGSVLERFNQTLNTRLVHSLPGQTRLSKAVRLLTKSHDPKRLATMTFTELADVLESFLFEYHDTLPNPITHVSPRDAFADDARVAGGEPQLAILPDFAFLLATMPSTKSGHATVRPNSGITLFRISYWHPTLRTHVGSRVAVRYDPYDLSVAYAQIDGVWVKCVSRKFFELLKGVTEKERQIVSAFCMRNSETHEKHRLFSATTLVTLLGAREKIPQLMAEGEKNVAEAAARLTRDATNVALDTVVIPPPLPSEVPEQQKPDASVPSLGFRTRRPKNYIARIVQLN